MSVLPTRPRLPWIVVAVSSAGLLIAGLFLYRWVNRLSEMDRQRQQENLDASMINLARGFSITLHETIWSFQASVEYPSAMASGDYLSRMYSQWKSTAQWPQLISTISVASKSPNGGTVLRRLDPATGKFEKQEWPSFLAPFRKALESASTREGSLHRFTMRDEDFFLLDGQPVLILPVLTAAHGERMSALFPAQREGAKGDVIQTAPEIAPPPPEAVSRELGPPPPGQLFVARFRYFPALRLTGWCFLELNLRFIQARLFPLVVQQYFGTTGLAKYRVAVVTGKPERVIYASSPMTVTKRTVPFDARIILFSPQTRLATVAVTPVEHLIRFGRRKPVPIGGDQAWVGPPSTLIELRNMRAGNDPNSWQLVATDKLGSLDADIAAVRRRNLAIGFGTLLLLACSIATLVIATHRAHMLAKRQLEFVAGISHELRTPLTVIESAAYNLARGTVDDPGRVQQYGEIIQTEGRRLSDLVGQTIAYAGVQAGQQRYELKPTPVLQVIDAALSEYDRVFREEGWRIEKKLGGCLPLASLDAEAVRSATKNLVENALKYASEGKWLGLTVRSVETWHGSEIQVSIADHGPGIDAADLPYIFEPFYRGQKVVASPVPGAGLGLNLVQRHMRAHGGKVTVHAVQGSGTEFTLHIPVDEAASTGSLQNREAGVSIGG